jgi:hypothetical protein
MSSSVKQSFSCWAVLLCALFAGLRAGAFLGDPCRSLNGSGNIESHQAMLADATRYQLAGEVEKNIVPLFAGFEPLAGLFDHAFFKPYANTRRHRIVNIHTWANDRQCSALVLKQVSNSNLDLSVLIAQFHVVSRFKTAFVIRRLYIFQNQFISIAKFSCLRDARKSTSVTRFGSISCPRPLVLSTYTVRALRSAPAVRRSSRPPRVKDRIQCDGQSLSASACEDSFPKWCREQFRNEGFCYGYDHRDEEALPVVSNPRIREQWRNQFCDDHPQKHPGINGEQIHNVKSITGGTTAKILRGQMNGGSPQNGGLSTEKEYL